MSESLEPEGFPINFAGGPDDLLGHYPEEMARLGTLSVFWVSTETALCQLLIALLQDAQIANALFYSTSNNQARRDMVIAVARVVPLAEGYFSYIEEAVNSMKRATAARNELLHGLFQVDASGAPFTYHRKSARKSPVQIKSDVSDRTKTAIHLCYRASAILHLVTHLVNISIRSEEDNQEIQRIESLLKRVPGLESLD